MPDGKAASFEPTMGSEIRNENLKTTVIFIPRRLIVNTSIYDQKKIKLNAKLP